MFALIVVRITNEDFKEDIIHSVLLPWVLVSGAVVEFVSCVRTMDIWM